MRLLQAEFHDGDTIVVDTAEGQLAFRKAAAPAAA
jgi:hypothetical protein